MKPQKPDADLIFGEALRLSVPAEREAYLDGACTGDPALRQEVESLLVAHAQAGDFLGRNRQAPPPDFLVEPTGTKVGRYKLLEKIGEGGFGVVYLAEQTEPVQRKVAVKIIKPGMDTREVVARFEAERQALALMDHPNIAKVLDGGTTEAGRPFFVMELVRGIRITDFCDQKALSTTERLQIFMHVCDAVQHAHQKGIIHRDLKPSNVLVTLYDTRPVPKIIDFGVAKALGQRLTEKTLFTAFRGMVGTPAYMSPEQAELSGLDIDTRSDIYSLGVLLYELLTGVTPFDAETLGRAALDEIRRMIRETEPVKPSTRLQTLGEKLTEVAKRRHTDPVALNRMVRGDLDWIVMKCLEKDRARRYDTATSLERDLRRHLGNEPVEARPPSNLYLLRKLLARHKLQFAAGGGFVAFLLASLALALVAGKAQERLRRQAEFEARNSEARRLFTEANYVVTSHPQRGLLLFVEALKVHLDHGEEPIRAIEQAFVPALTNISGFCLGTASGGLRSVVVSPNCRWVAAGGTGGEVLLWDLQSPDIRQSSKIISRGTNLVSTLSLSPDGQWLASGDAKGTVSIWRIGANGVSDSPPLLSHTNRINAALFGNQNRWLVTACESGNATLWDILGESPARKLAVFANERGAITALAITKKADRLILGDESGNVKVLQLPALTLVAGTGTTTRHSGKINAICLRQDDRELVTASEDGTARRWRLNDEGNVDLLTTLKGHRGGVTTVAYDSKGSVITGGADGQVLVWAASTSTTNATALTRHREAVFTLDYDPNESIITGAARNRTLAWYEHPSNAAPTLKSDAAALAYEAYERARNQIEKLESAPAAEDLEACVDPLAILLTPPQPVGLRIVAGGSPAPASTVGGVTSMTLTSNGRRIVTSGYDGAVIVTEPHKTVILRGHEGPVTSVAMNSSGDLIVTAGWDGSVRIWASQKLGSELPSLKPAFDVAQQVRAKLIRISANNPPLFDHAAFARDLVSLARDRIGRNLTPQEWHRVFPGRDYRKTFEEFPGL